MAWYRIGTTSATNGSKTITGTGTAWAANAQAGDLFQGPDFSSYEVDLVNSNTSITLVENYRGTTVASGGAYAIAPTQGRVRDLTATLAALTDSYSDVVNALTLDAGRLGLGKTPNANAKLDVAGQVWVDAPTGDAILRMLVSGAEKGKLAVTSTGRVYIESNGLEVMAWLNGNVSIGTTVANGKLNIASGGEKWMTLGAGSVPASFLELKTGAGGVLGYIGSDGGAAVSGGLGNNLAIRAEGDLILAAGGNVVRVRVVANGHVGVGSVAEPTQQLHVNGAVLVNGPAVLPAALGPGLLSLEGSVFREYIGDATGYTRAWSVRTGGVTIDRVTLKDNGNVGVGRPPTVKLDVNGALALSNLTSVAASAYTLLDTDSTLRILAACSLMLPAASSFSGRRLRVWNVGAFSLTSASSDVVPQGGSAAGSSILAATAGKWADLESNGTSWWIAASN